MEFAASVGEVSFADLGDDDAATLGANLEAAQIGGGAAQGFVGEVEAVLDARVSGAIKAMGTEEQVEFTQGQDCVGEERFDGAGRLAARGAGVVRRRALGAKMSAGTIVEESCCVLYQKTAPISARPRAFAGRKRFRAPGLGVGKKSTASGGSPTSNRVEGEG